MSNFVKHLPSFWNMTIFRLPFPGIKHCHFQSFKLNFDARWCCCGIDCFSSLRSFNSLWRSVWSLSRESCLVATPVIVWKSYINPTGITSWMYAKRTREAEAWPQSMIPELECGSAVTKVHFFRESLLSLDEASHICTFLSSCAQLVDSQILVTAALDTCLHPNSIPPSFNLRISHLPPPKNLRR